MSFYFFKLTNWLRKEVEGFWKVRECGMLGRLVCIAIATDAAPENDRVNKLTDNFLYISLS